MNLAELDVPPGDAAPGWGQSLSAGAAGITLLHLENLHTGAGDWSAAHQWARAMIRDSVTADPDTAGLFRGVPAVAFTLHSARQPAYAEVLRALDEHLATITRHRLRQAHDRIDRGQLPRLREFDLMSGLTGLGVGLLHRDRHPELLRDVLAYLVRLTEPITTNGEHLPGWWSEDSPNGQPSNDWPGGHANLGIAHGVAGPLALLATASRRGISVAGQTEAISHITTWLDRWRNGSGYDAWWPGMISRAEWHDQALRQSGPQRPSWCYGTAGLARAQQLAAIALGEPTRQRAAEHALAGCVSDERQLALLSDPSLCHGWAGLLQATRRTAADAIDDRLTEQLPALHLRLTKHLNDYGQSTESGLLEGAAGMLLALHATTTSDLVTRWDACLLLEG